MSVRFLRLFEKMMKNIFHAFFTVPLFVLVLVSCAPEEGAEDSMIDFSALTSRPLAELPDEKIASRVFIPMDTSRAEFLFDRVSDVKFRADRIYLLLWRRHNDTRLLVFDRKGRGVQVLDRRGQGPGEYAQISAFDVDEKGNIHIVDGQRDRLLVYDAQGRFVRGQDLPFEADDLRALPTGDYLFVLCNWNRGVSAGSKVALTGADLTVKRTYFRYPERVSADMILDSNGFSDAPGGMTALNESMNDRVYLFDRQGALADSLGVDFGRFAIPEAEKADVEKNVAGNPAYRCLSGPSSVSGSFLAGRMYRGRKCSYVIDRREKIVYSDRETDDPDALSVIVGFSPQGDIVSCIAPEMLAGGRGAHIPQEVRAYVGDENYALCLTRLR